MRTIEDMKERALDGYADPEDMLYVLAHLDRLMFPKEPKEKPKQ